MRFRWSEVLLSLETLVFFKQKWTSKKLPRFTYWQWTSGSQPSGVPCCRAHRRHTTGRVSLNVALSFCQHLYTFTPLHKTHFICICRIILKRQPLEAGLEYLFWWVTLHVFFLRFFLTLFLFEEVVFFLAFWLCHQPFTKAAQDSCPGPLKTAVESKNKSHKSLVLWGLQKCQNTNPWGKGAVISVLTFFQRVPGSPDGCLSELKPPPKKRNSQFFDFEPHTHNNKMRLISFLTVFSSNDSAWDRNKYKVEAETNYGKSRRVSEKSNYDTDCTSHEPGK